MGVPHRTTAWANPGGARALKILVVSDQWSPDVVGGSARVAAATSRLLAERGHEVTILSPRMESLAPIEREGTLELHRALRRVPLPQTFADPVDTWRFVKRWRDWPEIVVAHQATVATGVLAARVRAPLVYVFHASAPLEQQFLRRYAALPRRLASLALHPSLVLLERISARRAARILVLSEFSRGLLLDAHPHVADRVALVRGGVDASLFFPHTASQVAAIRTRRQLPLDRPFLLTARRLAPRMGVEELLQASRALVDRGLHFTLGIVGDGMLSGRLRALSKTLRLDDRVRFFGRVPDEALVELYSAADLFVLPTVAYEGFGMATLEALAAGTPVVGTPSGATPELLRPLDARLVAVSSAASDLAEAIGGALDWTDASFRARCSAYARERFDWGSVIGEWEAAIAHTSG